MALVLLVSGAAGFLGAVGNTSLSRTQLAEPIWAVSLAAFTVGTIAGLAAPWIRPRGERVSPWAWVAACAGSLGVILIVVALTRSAPL